MTRAAEIVLMRSERIDGIGIAGDGQIVAALKGLAAA
jgi:hypothetical protein